MAHTEGYLTPYSSVDIPSFLPHPSHWFTDLYISHTSKASIMLRVILLISGNSANLSRSLQMPNNHWMCSLSLTRFALPAISKASAPGTFIYALPRSIRHIVLEIIDIIGQMHWADQAQLFPHRHQTILSLKSPKLWLCASHYFMARYADITNSALQDSTSSQICKAAATNPDRG